MDFIVSAVLVGSVLGLTYLMGSLSSYLHPACSSLDFPDNDAYFAHLARRDRFFREEHVAMAGINTIITFGILSFFGWASFLPGAAMISATFLVWCFLRSVFPRPNQLILWDRLDKCMLLLALFAGLGCGCLAAAAMALATTSAIAPAVVFVICWCLLFPLG